MCRVFFSYIQTVTTFKQHTRIKSSLACAKYSVTPCRTKHHLQLRGANSELTSFTLSRYRERKKWEINRVWTKKTGNVFTWHIDRALCFGIGMSWGLLAPNSYITITYRQNCMYCMYVKSNIFEFRSASACWFCSLS